MKSAREKRDDQLVSLAYDAFEKHEVVGGTKIKWTIARPGSSSYWAEILCLTNGKLFVHGDIEYAFFVGGCEFLGINRVGWLASSEIGYVAKKASCAMGEKCVYEIDNDAGMVIAPRIYYAHAAIKRLWDDINGL